MLEPHTLSCSVAGNLPMRLKHDQGEHGRAWCDRRMVFGIAKRSGGKNKEVLRSVVVRTNTQMVCSVLGALISTV
jgi:hypothetical protein